MNSSPPEQRPLLSYKQRFVVSLRQQTFGQALAVNFDDYLVLRNSDTPHERGDDLHLACE